VVELLKSSGTGDDLLLGQPLRQISGIKIAGFATL
jgi:hypothetical protein